LEPRGGAISHPSSKRKKVSSKRKEKKIKEKKKEFEGQVSLNVMKPSSSSFTEFGDSSSFLLLRFAFFY
jgi:hypothetical protein